MYNKLVDLSNMCRCGLQTHKTPVKVNEILAMCRALYLAGSVLTQLKSPNPLPFNTLYSFFEYSIAIA